MNISYICKKKRKWQGPLAAATINIHVCFFLENYERKEDQQGLALIVNYSVNREGM